MGVARPRLLRNALASLAVLAAVAAVGAGLPVLDHAIAAETTLPAGRPYQLGVGVSLVPPAGATLDVSHTRPGHDSGTAVLRLGRARLAVQVTRFEGRLPDAERRLRDKLGRAVGQPVAGADRAVVTAAGVPGVAGDYPAGCWSVYVAGGVAVEAAVEGTGDERAAFVASLASLVIAP